MFKVVFLGPEGSFTHQASLAYFRDATLSSELSIEDIFYAVERNVSDFGVLPIENSTEGMVTNTLDSLMQSKLKIHQELELPIQHHLYTGPDFKSGDSIEKIYSHPQAFSQCKQFLKTRYPTVSCLLASSTSKAIELMLSDKKSAAIAGPQMLQYFNLVTLHEQIQDNEKNTTRFLVVGYEISQRAAQNKTSLMLALNDKPGALVHLLSPFSLLNINLTKIESRPKPGENWSQVFFVDLIGHIDDEAVQVALSVLKTIGVTVKHLGSYPLSQGLPQC